jgi:hypothetical protein
MATGVTRGGLRWVRRQPHACARWLTDGADLWGVDARVVHHDSRLTVFHVRFAPPPADLPGYPDEQVRITVAGDGRIQTVPVSGDKRAWYHRYPRLEVVDLLQLRSTDRVPWEVLVGALCLWYPDDPAHLRWHWSDGVDAYLRVVQRHLWSEEYWRRHGTWPVEDAPHGHRPDRRPHPIITPHLRSA